MISNQLSVISEESKQAFLAQHQQEYFWCEREHCLMKKSLCIAYQKQVSRSYRGEGLTQGGAVERSGCFNCEQGKKVAEELKASKGEKITMGESKIGICEKCGKERPIVARGMCRYCIISQKR